MGPLVGMDVGCHTAGLRPCSPGYRRCEGPVKPDPRSHPRVNPRPYHALPRHTTPPFSVIEPGLILAVTTNPGTGVHDYEWDQRSLSVAQTPRDSAIEDITDRLGSLSPGTHETLCTISSTTRINSFLVAMPTPSPHFKDVT